MNRPPIMAVIRRNGELLATLRLSNPVHRSRFNRWCQTNPHVLSREGQTLTATAR